MAAILIPAITSCSGGSGGSDTLLFGSLPGVHAEMQQAKEKFFEEAKTADSESQLKSLQEKGDKLGEEYAAKIEEAAKGLDGREVTITNGEIKVTSPVSLTYRKFFSKTDMTPCFEVNGAAEAAADFSPKSEYPQKMYTVYVVGYDANGTEVFDSRIGMIDAEENGGKAVVKAGTPVKFDELQFSGKKVDAYQQAATLKLEAR